MDIKDDWIKNSKFKSKNQWMKFKKFQMNLKFRLAEIFSNFSWKFTEQH